MANYWILKSEPSTYSFAQLVKDKRTVWDGVRNAQALMHIRSMKEGDLALFYHTGDARELVGVARIASAPYADPKAGDPRAAVVDLVPERALPKAVPLSTIKAEPALSTLGLVRQGRLSVVPVSPEQWKRLLAMAGAA